MGDISELRTLVTIGTFVSVCIILIVYIPSDLYVMTEDKKRVEAAEYWEAIDIMHFNETYNFNLTGWYPPSTGKVDIGGWTFEQFWTYNVSTYINRYEKFLFIFWRWMEMGTFWHENEELGTELTSVRMNADYASEGAGGLEYTVTFGSATQMEMRFSFNETLYDTPGNAWGNSELYGMWGMDFDHVKTGFNAWDIIAMILFFNLPSVHWVVNLIISIPLWIGIIYTAFILILRAIGAIFGGGA